MSDKRELTYSVCVCTKMFLSVLDPQAIPGAECDGKRSDTIALTEGSVTGLCRNVFKLSADVVGGQEPGDLV